MREGMKRTKAALALGIVALVGLGTAWVARASADEEEGGAKPRPRVRRDLQYAKIDGVDPNLLSLDVYAPATGDKHPVLVMIHGGGWSGGDKRNPGVATTKPRFFTERGYVYVTINYRLSPAVLHPAHIEDVAAALAFVHDHVAKVGGDPDRIQVMGHSAGAHLAALVSTDGRRLGAHGKGLGIIKGVILLDGAGYDIPAVMTGEDRRPGARTTYARAFGTDEAGWRDASPIAHVAAGKGIPPFLIFHAGAREASEVQAQALAGALGAAGVAARVVHAPGKDHGSINRDIGTPGDGPTRAILAFLANPGGL
jgi:acetyl esterase/lipase